MGKQARSLCMAALSWHKCPSLPHQKHGSLAHACVGRCCNNTMYSPEHACEFDVAACTPTALGVLISIRLAGWSIKMPLPSPTTFTESAQHMPGAATHSEHRVCKASIQGSCIPFHMDEFTTHDETNAVMHARRGEASMHATVWAHPKHNTHNGCGTRLLRVHWRHCSCPWSRHGEREATSSFVSQLLRHSRSSHQMISVNTSLTHQMLACQLSVLINRRWAPE
jgi:hypothetical protein